jgi:hypothetical protein
MVKEVLLTLPTGAGVDSVWEQNKLEARKMLVNRAESRQSTARFVSCHTCYADFYAE